MKKPIYNIFTLTARNIILTLALVSAVQAQGADGEVTTGELSAEALEGLKLQIVSPMTSGDEPLTANDALPRYFEIDGSNVIVHLNGLAEGQHRLTVKMQYGTQVEVLAIFDLVVPANLAAGDDEREVQISAVETIGDGSGTPFDPSQIEQEIAELQTEMAGKADAFTTDETPTEDSTNPVQSGGVYSALAEKADKSELPDMSNYATQQDLSDGLAGKQPAGTYADGAVYTKDENNGPARIVGAVAEGNGTNASGNNSHAEGIKTVASGIGSHAEGCGFVDTADGPKATGRGSHAEGIKTVASGIGSHAEGSSTTANGNYSHVEGRNTTASGVGSHAEGSGTIASVDDQHVCGRFNVASSNYALIVGNGTDNDNRSNAFAINWSGNLVLFNNGTPVVLTPAKLAQLIA